MALSINRSQQRVTGIVSDRRLYLTVDKAEVVEDGDPRAAFLFATPGVEIAAGDVERLGLSAEGGKVVLAASAEAGSDDPPQANDPPTDPVDEGEADAIEWTLKTSPEEYLEKHPDGPNAELARSVLAARGSDGDS